MFEARLRAYQHEQSLGPRPDQSQTRNRFTATSAIYRNRIYGSVFASNKTEGASLAKKRHEETIHQLIDKRQKISNDIASQQWHHTTDFVGTLLAEKELERERLELEAVISKKQVQDPEKLWYDRVQSLHPEQVGSLAVLSYASGNTEEIFNVDPDRCTCGRILHFTCVTHMDICLTCRKCKKVLLAAEDLQTDLMHKMPSNPSTTTVAAITDKTNVDQMMLQDSSSSSLVPTSDKMIVAKTPVPTPKAMKPPSHAAYKRYLMQFSDKACEIPKDAWSLLYESLASIHLLSNLRCKPVPVERIFKTNRFQSLMSHSTRISKLFNTEPIPVLTTPMITRLVQRYDELYQTATVMFERKQYSKATLPGKEILTHIFLRMENRADLASAFTTHKTNNVSQDQNTAFWNLLLECSKTSSLKWTY
jgi:hypothetical protein